MALASRSRPAERFSIVSGSLAASRWKADSLPLLAPRATVMPAREVAGWKDPLSALRKKKDRECGSPSSK